MIIKIVLIALAGAFGTLSRYFMTGVIQRLSGTAFPWGTLIINIVGCFFVGLLWTIFESRFPVASQTRTMILVGFFGAFTTFSTFIFETEQLLSSSQWLYAIFNITVQNIGGLIGLFSGVIIARTI